MLLESHGIDPKKSDNSLLMHTFYAVADIGNGQEVLKLYVEEMNNVNSENNTQRTYMLQNITKQSGSSGSQNKSISHVTPTAIKTVSDLFGLVKQNDKNFNPKPSGKVVNADGTPKVKKDKKSYIVAGVWKDNKIDNDMISIK